MSAIVNDIHAQLNATRVSRIVTPTTVDEVVDLVAHAAKHSQQLSTAGGRHAMGGQAFASNRTLIDCRGLNRLISFDDDKGLIRVEAGAQWPEIIQHTHAAQLGGIRWGIRQKQTGADAMTLAGTISANAHGRGLLMGPIVDDIEDLTLVSPEAEVITCSRTEHADLFRHAVGGYGLFGVIVAATLRLAPRRRLRRIVDVLDIDDAMHAVERRIAEGCVYGDFQYAIDPTDDAFLRRGVMACYLPVDASEHDDDAHDLPREQWLELLKLAHTDKHKAFSVYAQHYLNTHGRTYWSDTMQLSTYIPTYAEFLSSSGLSPSSSVKETLLIGELAVPPERLTELLNRSRAILRTQGVEDIYGTIRSLRRDTITALPFAKCDMATVIFNLRTPHTPTGISRTHETFRKLHDAALDLGGSFYLTYHRAAPIDQLRRAYPGFDGFLDFKARHDPRCVFTSDWYEDYFAHAKRGPRVLS